MTLRCASGVFDLQRGEPSAMVRTPLISSTPPQSFQDGDVCTPGTSVLMRLRISEGRVFCFVVLAHTAQRRKAHLAAHACGRRHPY